MSQYASVLAWLQQLQSDGGPRPEQDARLSEALSWAWQMISEGRTPEDYLARVREAFNFTLESMQGFAFLKPNGYPGCYEIIDRTYRRYHASNPSIFNWDRYWQAQPAAHAVRNRKAYLSELVFNEIGRMGQTSLLNVASGPCRDVLELFEACPELRIHVDCSEQDPRAIDYAKTLCSRYLDRISFEQRNALRFTPVKRYDLVWSAGLFDYLSDKLFTKLLSRLGGAVERGGELVIGNFAASNPNRGYMELFGWSLQHRSPEELISLAESAGFARSGIEVRNEPSGVNLFLHIHPTSL